ncbi:DUF262 domain-containing protein [Knoellia sp. CPCC 206450]|uniref:DUF262 domain-containing protein n=1 Tax=Knoellia tibetensis TaxID=3404798 RepID=UPI003B42993A
MITQNLTGYPSTFVELFDPAQHGRPAITSIEIPIIQRDFAQGRPDDEASAIRERFLDAIVGACVTDTGMALDFIYGDVKEGTLRPLDGQQRLTTLFLLHWYVASLAEVLDHEAAWLRFSYATRPTARDFCDSLAEHPYPGGCVPPSAWITDQPWYVYPWRQDPTISSMLVMLDALHERFDTGTDFGDVWDRLESRSNRAIWFLFLPVADMDYGEDLYIKMNSRGKQLTQFEVFKADLEGMLKPVLSGRGCHVDAHTHDRYEHLAMSIDGDWADILWEYEKADNSDYVVDDEFMRYLTFVIDICEWRDGQPDRRWRDKSTSREWPIEERARLSFADATNEYAERNRDFFFHAFDTWLGVSPDIEFSKLFTAGGSGEGPLPLLVSTSPDLFGSCIRSYGQEFSLAETLMLFAVLLSRQGDEMEPGQRDRRLRTLRNLAESAFIDRKRMAEYVGTVERLMLQGTLEGAEAFNAEWTSDETDKWELVDEHEDVEEALHKLEDLPVVRGRLFAFELDANSLGTRADVFALLAEPTLRDALGATLLTKADYSRDVGWGGTRRQLGSSTKDDSWRDLFTTGSRASVARTRVPLMELLDDVHARLQNSGMSPAEVLAEIRREWLNDRESRNYFDWRYYFVRYAGARSSVGEGYFHNQGYDATRGGFSYGRLRMLHGGSYNAYFSDALLRAAWVDGGLTDLAREPKWWHRDDPGMGMRHSAVEIRCVDDGFEVVLPNEDDDVAARVMTALESFAGSIGSRVVLKQDEHDGVLIDSEDRVQICASLVKHLHHNAGL